MSIPLDIVKVNLCKKVIDAIPKDSVGRYDLLPLFQDKVLFAEIVEYLSMPYIGNVDYIAAPEAIGWIIGSAMAFKLKTGFIALRKVGKLPYSQNALVIGNYTDYSGDKALTIKKNAVITGEKVLLVDEWVETGETLLCGMKLLHECGYNIIGMATIGIDYNEKTKDWIETGFIRFIGQNI